MEFVSTIFNPGVLFFILGFVAIMLKSNLHIPEQVVKFISLYLMLSIGFKGGISLYHAPLFGDGILIIAIIMVMSALVPVAAFYLLRKKVGDFDAAAIGATYGSNSTLTYITAVGFLTSAGISYGGYMTVALVVMETPAIVFAILIARWANKSDHTQSTWSIAKKALTDGTLLTLVGAMIIGYLMMVMGEEESPLAAFISGDMFTGMLIFFLLYMGTLVGHKVRELERFPLTLGVFAVVAPIVNGVIAFLLSMAFGFDQGDAFLLIILCASASYIVAPAILKEAMPEANPAQYLTMSMAITFPLNIIVGIPVYWWLVESYL